MNGLIDARFMVFGFFFSFLSLYRQEASLIRNAVEASPSGKSDLFSEME